MPVIPSPEISHRDEFPLLCDWRMLETAIEIGVDRGTYSQHFFRCHTLRHFIGIDDYEPHAEFPYTREADRLMAANRYSHCHFASLMCAPDWFIAKAIASGELGHIKERQVDFVYIDAGHEYADVMADINIWWPLISRRGILAGHDYDHTHPGVVQAVDEFAANTDCTVYTTREHPSSWYCYKSGMPGADWRRIAQE